MPALISRIHPRLGKVVVHAGGQTALALGDVLALAGVKEAEPPHRSRIPG